MKGWQFWVDRGGTFTDVVAQRPDGRLLIRTLLSDHPARYSDAAVAGSQELLAEAGEAPTSPLSGPDRGHASRHEPGAGSGADRGRISARHSGRRNEGAPEPEHRNGPLAESVRMGTTAATNALLERTGERTLLVVTRGFRDALRVAYQNRPQIFAREIELPELLHERVIEADERMAADGTVLRAPDLDALAGPRQGALRVQAEGSGTMNNVTFGNERYQYNETVASGSGAGDGFPGAPVVRTHMTNSRLTDPEVLERRLPVHLDEFAVRRGSGGAGRWPGGDGAVRRIRFREPMTVSTLPRHRRVPPCGMGGGEPGALCANRVEHADGTVTELAGSGTASVVPGDVLVIETPGGGGYGPPPHDTAEAHETAVACDVSEARGTTEARDTTEAGEETDDLRAH